MGDEADDLIDAFLDFLCDTGIGDLKVGPPKKFAGFFEEHCEVFKEHRQQGEHQLEYTRIFKLYEALVDDHLSEFAATKGLDLSEVFAFLQKVSGRRSIHHLFFEVPKVANCTPLTRRCTSLQASQEDDFVRAIIGMVLASCDYDSFVEYMVKKSRGNAADSFAEAKEQPSAEFVDDDYFMKADRDQKEEDQLRVEGQSINISPAESKGEGDSNGDAGGKEEKGGEASGAKG
jgi:hypothetical protein